MPLIDRRQGLWSLAALGVASALPLAWARRAQAVTVQRGVLAVVEKGTGASPSIACPMASGWAKFR